MSFPSINGPCTQRKNIKWEKHINIPFNYNYIKYIDKRCFISLYELKIIWATIFWKEIASFIWVNFSLLNRGGQRIFWRFLYVFNNSQEWNVSFIIKQCWYKRNGYPICESIAHFPQQADESSKLHYAIFLHINSAIN